MLHTESGLPDACVAALPERPATFAERGAAVPFTSPMLAGIRLRRSQARPPELLLPALGGRGIYILSWDACLSPCRPTLFDRKLWEGLATPARITPRAVRAAVRNALASGLAGRPAQAAAAAQAQALEAMRGTAREELKVVLGRHAQRAELAPALDTLVGALAECGVATLPGPALLARLATLEALAVSVSEWGEASPGFDDRRAAALLAGAARLTIAAVLACLPPLRLALEELPFRLISRPEVPADFLSLAERPDWLLDGWDGIAQLWNGARREDRDLVLRDALVRLPVPAAEADGWPGPVADWDAVLRGRRRLAPRPAWAVRPRAGLVQWHEQMHGRAA
jgi:hypothetical protein